MPDLIDPTKLFTPHSRPGAVARPRPMSPRPCGRFCARTSIGVLLWALLCLTPAHASPPPQGLEPPGLRIEPLAMRWGPIYTVDLAGRFAYVGMGRRLVVYDLSDPEAPRPRGRTELLADSLREVKVEDGMAFAIDFGNGFHVFDVSNPDRPIHIAELEVRSEIGGFPLGAQRLFVHDGVADLLMVEGEWLMLDVSNPVQPRLVEQRRQHTIGSLMDPGAVQRVSDRMYVVDRGGSLHVFDVSDPFNPQALGSAHGTTGPIRLEGGRRSGGVTVVGNEAITLSGWNALYTFDVSTTITPTRLGEFGRFEHDAGGLARLGDLAIVTEGAVKASSYVDLTRPMSPTLVGSGPAAAAVAADGDLAMLATGNWLSTLESRSDWEDEDYGDACSMREDDPDLSLGAVLLEKESGTMSTRSRIHTLADVDAFVRGGTRIFANVGRRGIVAIDGSDLGAPRLLDPPQLQLRHAPWAIDADARRLVVAAGRELCIFDHGAGWLPDLQAAFWLGGAGIPEDGGILLDGEIVWVASKGLLRAIDLSSQEPRELGAIAIPENVSRLARVEGDLVLLDPTGAVVVIDIVDPSAPRLKVTNSLGSRMLNMAVEGRMLYLADGVLLTAARLGTAGDLEPLGSIDLNMIVVGESAIEARGSMVFVGDAGGVHVIDASVPTALDEVGRLEGWPAGSLVLHVDGRHMLLAGRPFSGSREPWGVLGARFDPPATVTPDPSRPTPTATVTPEASPTPRNTSAPSPSATAAATSTPVAPASPIPDPSPEPSATPASLVWLPWLLNVELDP